MRMKNRKQIKTVENPESQIMRRNPMTISRKDRQEQKYEEMKDILEDMSVQIQEIREEFISAMDDLEDMIAEV